MDGLQITLGDGPNWLQLLTPALAPALVGAGAALFGVWMTNRAAASHRREEASNRTWAKREQERRDSKLRRRDRRLAGLLLSTHLEDYVLSCAHVLSHNLSLKWTSPHEATGDYGDDPRPFTILPTWPELIDWRALGPDIANNAQNLKRRTELTRITLTAGAAHLSRQDQNRDEADAAAIMANEAWTLATAVRERNDLPRPSLADTWDFMETVEQHLKDRAKRLDREAAADAAFWAELADNPPDNSLKGV